MVSNGFKILDFLVKKPFTKYTDIMEELNIPKDDFPEATAWLEKKGYIEIEQVQRQIQNRHAIC